MMEKKKLLWIIIGIILILLSLKNIFHYSIDAILKIMLLFQTADKSHELDKALAWSILSLAVYAGILTIAIGILRFKKWTTRPILLVSIIITIIFLLGKEPKPQLIIEKTEMMMRGIYNDIITISDKYEELKNFKKSAYYYEGVYETDKWRKLFGYLVNASSIAFYGFSGEVSPSPCPSIRFDFTKDTYSHRVMACSPVRPAYKAYVKEVGFYLIFEHRLENEKLKNELIEIAKRNINLYRKFTSLASK